MKHPTEWQPFDVILRRPILIDGTRAKWFAQLMRRRRPDGRWEYRAAAESDRGQIQKDEAL